MADRFVLNPPQILLNMLPGSVWADLTQFRFFGGVIRDLCLGLEPRDWDLLVYSQKELELEQVKIEKLLKRLGYQYQLNLLGNQEEIIKKALKLVSKGLPQSEAIEAAIDQLAFGVQYVLETGLRIEIFYGYQRADFDVNNLYLEPGTGWIRSLSGSVENILKGLMQKKARALDHPCQERIDRIRSKGFEII